MPKHTVYKTLSLSIEIEADSAQAAFDQTLHMDDNTFTVHECDYAVFDANNVEVYDVDMGG
jgi:hypothetical protein